MAIPHTRRVGVFGGTFDPIHIGHLCIAEEARASLELHQVLFIPAHVSPFKLGQGTTSGAQRLDMVQLAIADNAAFRASDIELKRPGPSYTIDTLRQLGAECGAETELYLILGGDSLASLAAWRQAQELPKLARIALYPRPGFTPDLARLEQQIPGIGTALTRLDAPLLEISATAIRARVSSGRSIRYLVPAAVQAYIREHGLYSAQLNGQRPSAAKPCS